MKKSIILCGLLAFATSSFSSVKAKNRYYSTASLATQTLSEVQAKKSGISWGMVLRITIAGILVAVVGGLGSMYYDKLDFGYGTKYWLTSIIVFIVSIIINYVTFQTLGPKPNQEDEE